MPQLKIFVRLNISHITCRYDSLFRIHTRLLLLLEEISFQNMVPVYHDNVETRKRYIHILSEGVKIIQFGCLSLWSSFCKKKIA